MEVQKDKHSDLYVKQKDDGYLAPNSILCIKLVKILLHLAMTRQDISHAVNIVCQFMSDPLHHHLEVIF